MNIRLLFPYRKSPPVRCTLHHTGGLFSCHQEVKQAHRPEGQARRKILCKRYSTKSRMALESRADSGLNPLFTESHGGQNGMRAGTA